MFSHFTIAPEDKSFEISILRLLASWRENDLLTGSAY